MIFTSLLLLSSMTADPKVDCENPQYQVEMNLCALKDYERADAALNAQWTLTAAQMKAYDKDIDRTYDTQPTHFATLLAAQRAWLTYRDQHCLGESFAVRGGSMAPMLHSGCMARLTEARTVQLKDIIEEY